MSSRHESEARTIHPRALYELGEEAAIIALGVARDLRSGGIPPEKFDMRWLHLNESRGSCGSACCIAGWMMIRGVDNGLLSEADTGNLFAGYHPSDPLLAADAIERYVYDGSDAPWSTT